MLTSLVVSVLVYVSLYLYSLVVGVCFVFYECWAC